MPKNRKKNIGTFALTRTLRTYLLRDFRILLTTEKFIFSEIIYKVQLPRSDHSIISGSGKNDCKNGGFSRKISSQSSSILLSPKHFFLQKILKAFKPSSLRCTLENLEIKQKIEKLEYRIYHPNLFYKKETKIAQIKYIKFLQKLFTTYFVLLYFKRFFNVSNLTLFESQTNPFIFSSFLTIFFECLIIFIIQAREPIFLRISYLNRLDFSVKRKILKEKLMRSVGSKILRIFQVTHHHLVAKTNHEVFFFWLLPVLIVREKIHGILLSDFFLIFLDQTELRDISVIGVKCGAYEDDVAFRYEIKGEVLSFGRIFHGSVRSGLDGSRRVEFGSPLLLVSVSAVRHFSVVANDLERTVILHWIHLNLMQLSKK